MNSRDCNTSGDSLGATKYLPYGETRSGSVPTDKQFTGQRLDDTGLYYYNARYYDPTIGRFISADIIVSNPANPQSFNRYSYCLNNPLKYIDPSGYDVYINDWNVEATRGMWQSGINYYIPSEYWEEVIDVVNSTEYQVYEAFRKSSYKAAHMALTMETSTEHTIYIDSSFEAKQYAEYNRSGNDHTITFHPFTFIECQIWEIGFPILYGMVDWYILDTHPNYDYIDAVKEVLIDDLISFSKKLETFINVAEFAWTVKTKSLAEATGELIIAYTPISPVWTFLSNLIGQQRTYDFLMSYYNIPYPFKDN